MNCRDLSTLQGTDSSPGNGCRTTCPIEDFGRGNQIFNMYFKSYFANQYPSTSVFQYDVANRFTGRYMVNELSLIAWNYITFYVAPRLQNPCLNIAKKETIRNKGRWYFLWKICMVLRTIKDIWNGLHKTDKQLLYNWYKWCEVYISMA